MNLPQTCLSAELLRQLTHDELSPSELEEVENHVSDCERCRQLLEAPQSDSQWQDEIVPILRTPVKSLQAASDQLDRGSEYESLESILRLLGPTDDPHMLGRIGSYEVVGVIGRGGMGVVFKAFEPALNRFVAIKMLLPHLATSGAARKRFAREGQAAAAVIDDNVLPIYSVAEWKEIPYLVTQYSRGVTLHKRIQDQGPLEVKEILRIGMQTARGLAAAHSQGLVHRDVKPSNILLDGTVERALLTDFGLARAVDDASITRTGIIAGTPQYMSPEQARAGTVDARSDLFSLGCVLYTMCTGRPPFRADNSYAILRLITDAEPRPIREINPDVPEWLCRLVSKLMAKSPVSRFDSASEVAVLLERCLAHVQQPEVNSLPHEADQMQADFSKLPFLRFLYPKARLPMLRFIVPIAVILALCATYFLQSPSTSDVVAKLQGEWVLVSAERDGTALPADQLFNERLIIEGTRFSRPQTAPNGTEIKGEQGKLSIDSSDSADSIDFVLWEGTAHGLYRLDGDELTLCVTREGGTRPDSFQTKNGDSRVLQTFRRKTKAKVATSQLDERDRAWKDVWMKRIPEELSGPLHRDKAEAWMREHGFTNIVSGDITLKVMQRIHPGIDEPALKRGGISGYLQGTLRPEQDNEKHNAIEVHCLFDANDKMLSLHVGPIISEKQPEQTSALSGDNAGEFDLPLRLASPMSRPVMADRAPILACLGPEHPVRLGDVISHSEIQQGLAPEVVRLHVWDWSKSDLSRILLIQRSEVGSLSPDGKVMLTQEGETIDLVSKATLQYSGFKVPDGQRIVALQASPTTAYVAATVHVRTEVEKIPTDPPTLDTRHFWALRLLKLDGLTHRGHKVGEYETDARAGVAFTADESAIIHSTDQHRIVRRELGTGRILNTYEPSFGVHGAVGLAISPDGRMVAAAGYHGAIYMWDMQSGDLLMQHDALRPDGERDPFFKAGVLRFSPDSGKLAAVSGNHIKIIDAGTGKVIREHRDTTRPRYVHVHWSNDAKTITLLTSAQLSEYSSQPLDQSAPTRRADRFPRVYEWAWETGEPEVKQYPAADATDASQIDPDMEMRRLTGTWRIVDRSTAGVKQSADIGTTVQILHGRMGEVRLELDPNRTPRTVDIVFLEGPEKGKVLRGIYEWLPARRSNVLDGALDGALDSTSGTGESLRICTFTEPHPEKPDERPRGFQSSNEVDTAVWELISHDAKKIKQAEVIGSEHSEKHDRDQVPVPVDVDDVEPPNSDGVPHSD